MAERGRVAERVVTVEYSALLCPFIPQCSVFVPGFSPVISAGLSAGGQAESGEHRCPRQTVRAPSCRVTVGKNI